MLTVSQWSAPRPVYTVTPTQEDVDWFLWNLEEDVPGLYEDDVCWQVTPPGLFEQTDYQLFKYEKSCASYLFYDARVFPLGAWFGGSGLDSAAAADLNGDGTEELLFTYSWGSGLYHAQLGYFDPMTAEVVLLDYCAQAPLLVTDSGAVYYAAYDPGSTFVSGTLRGVELAGWLRWDGERIVFKEAL